MDLVRFAHKLYEELRERRAQLASDLANGAARNHEQYREIVGEIRGISFAEETLRALLEKTSDEDGL